MTLHLCFLIFIILLSATSVVKFSKPCTGTITATLALTTSYTFCFKQQ